MNCIQLIPQKQLPQKCEFQTYLCLEQPQTIDYLSYIELEQQKLQNNDAFYQKQTSVIFNSDNDENNKKGKRIKKFSYNGIFKRAQKTKHYFGEMIKKIVEKAICGQNQTVFLYGTEQICKDKLIFGESQNPGLFLCVLSQLFEFCHKKGIQDFVTIKLSCCLFSNSKFIQIFTQLGGVQLGKDILQGCILHTIPQIIIRNVKTGLKILNIILKCLVDMREEEITENLILTMKLQLDCLKVEEETQLYCISKINFVKLANPSVNNSLKGINRSNIWFINLLNLLQNSKEKDNFTAILDNLAPLSDHHDRFTIFLKQTVFNNSSNFYSLISINNKMTSNQCLTALLFGNHLKQQNITPKTIFIDLSVLSKKIQGMQNKVVKIVQKSLENRNVQAKDLHIWEYMSEYMELIESYMTQLNYLQYEYSLLIGEACEKLNKYIFTQELQDFFYAKKVNLEPVGQLKETYKQIGLTRQSLLNVRKKIITSTHSEDTKVLLDTLMKYQYSMAHHFLYQPNQSLNKALSNVLDTLKQLSTDVKFVLQPMMSKSDNKQRRTNKTMKDNSLQEIKEEQTSRMCNNIGVKNNKRSPMKNSGMDDLELMFKNKNVGLKKWIK